MTENRSTSESSSTSELGIEESDKNSRAPDPKRQCRKNEENSSTFDEDSCCSICFEPYTNGGSHRLSCLKCGHLFGCSCIKKWLVRGSTRRNYCPQCKTPAKLTDIRNHYCKGIKVLDTSEKDALHKSLESERENKRHLMIELATLKQKCDSLQREMEKMKLDLDRNRDSKLTSIKTNDVNYSKNVVPSNEKKCKANFVRKLEICREGESRVMAFCQPMDLLAVSGRQNTALFNHSGLKKIDMHNLRCTDFVPLHNEVIRDVKFSQNFTALTASFDKMMCLSSLHNNCVMQRWNLGQRVWSCCFKSDQSCFVFGATQNGRVLMFDSRMINQQQQDASSQNEVLELANLQKPIFNLHWVSNLNGLNVSGLLISSIDKCIFMSQNSPTNFTPHVLSSEGRHYSTSYCNDHVMLSYGPSILRSTTEHSVAALARSAPDENSDLNYTLNSVSTLKGGAKQTLMCRNLLTRHPVDEAQLLAATYEESLNTVQIWNASSPGNGGLLEQVHLARNETVYDMNAFRTNDRNFFATLNNKFLSLYTMDFL